MATTTKTVLIADDDWDFADALALRASAMGLNARTAHDALATVHALQRQAPDFLILDINMPAGDGLTVCEAMVSDSLLARIPVLILTGRNDPGAIQRCRQAGAYYLHKSPNVWPQIERLLVEWLDPPTRPSATTRPKQSAWS